MPKRVGWIIFWLIIGLSVQVLFDPLAGVLNTMRILLYRFELPLAQARWQNAGLAEYQVDVHGSIPLDCLISVRLITREGKLEKAQNISFVRGPKTEVWGDYINMNNPGCDINNITIPGTFQQVSDLLKDINPLETEVNISLNLEYGYVTYFEMGTLHSRGILVPGMADCCSHFYFDNFETSP